ncbi:type II toxin-antitoxin system PemK/MazF family toxin [Ekhidna sp.]|uniref:type II toxin-antitoxin system PemK/MazF family toxin n=1 Tax=Ekhidna sp. TaxID=2608089 RepID=UPI003CCBB6CB
MKLEFGTIVLLKFPFSDLKKSKKRPALVILDAGDGDILVARITSKEYHSHFDVVLDNWETYNLKLPSVVRLHKLATLNVGMVDSILGKLDKKDFNKVRSSQSPFDLLRVDG